MERAFFNTKTLLLDQGSPEVFKNQLIQYFNDSFDLDEHLFEVFADEQAMYMRADPLRHPLIFYFGHTAVFYVNKLILSKQLTQRVNPAFESMFAIGVDEMSWDDLNMANYNWPAVDEVRAYRQQVRQMVNDLIERTPVSLPVGWDNPLWIILMGIEHSRIHLETSSVLIRQLPLNYLKPIAGWNICGERGKAPLNELIEVKGRSVHLGKSFSHNLYGWDNEYGTHDAVIDDFKASKYLCSNGEFLEFIQSGGYDDAQNWTEEGWRWKTFEAKGHPRFWRKTESGWNLRLVFNEIEMPWNWPVEVNYLEAKAFCNWKTAQTGKTIRLPMEEEWQLLYNQSQIPDQPYWKMAPGNINMEHFQSPAPVNTFAFGPFFDVIGNVWQWTETPINGFKNFKIHPYYDDFSTPTFDLQHNLIKGGSWISTGNEATAHARYAFRRHFYQHAGFRYVESNQQVIVNADVYETDQEVTQNCEAHYGSPSFNTANYNEQLAHFCVELFDNKPSRRALDLGCQVGRTTWELARHFDHVTGLDFTARNIRVGTRLQADGSAKYQFQYQGELVAFNEIQLKELGLEGLSEKVAFWQADASNLKPIFSNYDLIVLNDLIDRTTNPRKLLSTIHERLNSNGILVIASAYNFAESASPEVRIGGYREDGEPVTAFDDLKRLLSERFQLLKTSELIRVLPQSQRVAQLHNMHITAWSLK